MAAVCGAVVIGGLIAWYGSGLPDISRLDGLTRRPSVTLLSADGTMLATFGDLYGAPVQLHELPPHLPQAVLAVEDRRFYSHFGLDLWGVTRAVLANLRAGRIVQGGSTITQQLAKNLFLKPERTIRRKVQETLLALWLERRFSKDQILTIYLNRVYLGAGTYGVEAAARRFFGKSARQVSLYQAAMLAGLLKAPSRYNPVSDRELAAARARWVLAAMVDAGYLTPERAAAAERQPPWLATSALGQGRRYFADWVLEQVSSYVGYSDRDLTVVTTLDPRLQRLADAQVAAVLAGPGKKAGAGQAALVGLAPDGAVKAMVGGRDYSESQFNRATQALRQPGSAFKLFVYLAGLEAGLEPDDTMMDAPVAVGGWHPRNYDGRYYGEVTLRGALARSLNSVAVRLTEQVGRDRVIAAARRLGITSELRPEPSLALGASEVTLIELTAAYAVLANNGVGVWAYGIREVRDDRGRVLYRRSGSGPGRVIALDLLARMNDMLGAVVAWGTGRGARLDRPMAGKTGTSQDFRDAWFIGYTADLVTGVWIGNDDGQAMKDVVGGGLPARLWRSFMAEALKGLAIRPLPGLGLPEPRSAADRESGAGLALGAGR